MKYAILLIINECGIQSVYVSVYLCIEWCSAGYIHFHPNVRVLVSSALIGVTFPFKWVLLLLSHSVNCHGYFL